MEYIRKATAADAERIRFIAEHCWLLASRNAEAQKNIKQLIHDFYSYGKLTNEINSGISVFLLAIDEELAVAFTSYTFKNNAVISCELNALYCLPVTQGKRLDELLVHEVIKNTIAVGGVKIFVLLTHYNGQVGLFERLGFEPLKMNDQEFDSEMLVMGKNIGIFLSE
jgi:N-acetylglutamate synthase-like GNAT family acetyltransferase